MHKLIEFYILGEIFNFIVVDLDIVYDQVVYTQMLPVEMAFGYKLELLDMFVNLLDICDKLQLPLRMENNDKRYLTIDIVDQFSNVVMNAIALYVNEKKTFTFTIWNKKVVSLVMFVFKHVVDHKAILVLNLDVGKFDQLIFHELYHSFQTAQKLEHFMRIRDAYVKGKGRVVDDGILYEKLKPIIVTFHNGIVMTFDL